MGEKRKSIDCNTYTTWSGQEMTISHTSCMRVNVTIGTEQLRVKSAEVRRSRFEQGEIVLCIPLSPTEFEFDVDTIPNYRTSVKETRDGVEKHIAPD